VRRFQDSKDKNSTANLKAHAIKCFGAEAVNNAVKGSNAPGRSGSIFAQFARRGQEPVKFSYRAHTSDEARYVQLTDSDCLILILTLAIVPTSLSGWSKATGRSASLRIVPSVNYSVQGVRHSSCHHRPLSRATSEQVLSIAESGLVNCCVYVLPLYVNATN
jgi:hypothetical protein